MAFYGGFQGLPDHCQDRVLMNLDTPLTDTFGWHPSSLKRIDGLVDFSPNSPNGSDGGLSIASRTMGRALTISHKSASDGDGAPDCEDSGGIIRVCTKEKGLADASLPSDLAQHLDASAGDPKLGGNAKDRRTLNLIADKAINLLKTNKKCRDALSSKSLDALYVLEQLRPNDLYEDFGLINAGDRDEDYLAWTYYGPIQGVTRGAIEFYKDFFDNADSAMGDGLVSDKLTSLEDRQILVILHEIGHANRKYVHPNEMNWVQEQGAKLIIDYKWDNATVNQFIYDNCFKK
ncbi:MAG: hypothetical protein KF756_11000 [Acidobacteria bacterium]|nr:hypothetical protein [Acidobacteriota bacterium]